MDLTYVWADLCAFHTDPVQDPAINEGRHAHVWRVTAYFDSAVFRDTRVLRAALGGLLAAWQDRDLPPELWASEKLAQAVFQTLGNADCIGVRVERHDARMGATAGICS